MTRKYNSKDNIQIIRIFLDKIDELEIEDFSVDLEYDKIIFHVYESRLPIIVEIEEKPENRVRISLCDGVYDDCDSRILDYEMLQELTTICRDIEIFLTFCTSEI